MGAPPYSTARSRSSASRTATPTDVVAVEEPLEIRIGGAPGRRDDAHARPRRGAGARLLPLRGAAAGGARGCRTIWPRTRSSVDAPGLRSRRGSRAASTPSSSCGVCGKGALEAVAVEAPRVESELPRAARRSSRRCPTGSARRSRRSTRPAACTRPGSSTRGRAALPARGRRPPQRDGQGDRLGVRRRAAAARATRALRQRPAVVRARAEGGGRRVPDARRGRRAVVARGRARRATAA